MSCSPFNSNQKYEIVELCHGLSQVNYHKWDYTINELAWRRNINYNQKRKHLLNQALNAILPFKHLALNVQPLNWKVTALTTILSRLQNCMIIMLKNVVHFIHYTATATSRDTVKFQHRGWIHSLLI